MKRLNSKKACKQARKQAIRERAERAIRAMYHNATPRYPDCQNDYESDLFHSRFSDYASSEIDYIQSGGANGNIQQTADNYVAKKYKNFATGRMAARLYARRAVNERAKYAPWESISDFGKLYQYGRGGRTLAPQKLVNQRGGSSFSLREDYFAESPISEVIQGIRIIEYFNSFVESWNSDIPSWWKEEKEANEYQADIDAHDGKTSRFVKVWA